MTLPNCPCTKGYCFREKYPLVPLKFECKREVKFTRLFKDEDLSICSGCSAIVRVLDQFNHREFHENVNFTIAQVDKSLIEQSEEILELQQKVSPDD